MQTQFDYIVIGSGAGGAAAAYGLVQRGLSVLLLEKGGVLPRDGSTLSVQAVVREGRFANRERWTDGRGRSLAPGECYNLGGKTKWYGAALLRYGEDEFGADEDLGFLPWPIGADELAPYYAQAELLLGVREFAYEPDLVRLLGPLGKKGWQARPLPLGLAADILRHPVEAQHFDGFASPAGLKADSDQALLSRLANHPAFRLLTDVAVTALLPAPNDPRRVVGVACTQGRSFQARRGVVLAAGALNSPRLLAGYLSATGLDTILPGADLVGRYYKAHLKSFLVCFGARPVTDLLRKTVLLTHAELPHSSVQTLGWIDGEVLGAQMPRWLPRPLAGLLGARAYGFFLQTEDGSHRDNCVQALGPAGHPSLSHEPGRTPHARREHRALIRKFSMALLAAGRLPFVRAVPLAATGHAGGTLVAGHDPGRSVVDAAGCVHGMTNLHVADGSVLPRSARVNPSLTIYAWGLRLAAHLSDAQTPARSAPALATPGE